MSTTTSFEYGESPRLAFLSVILLLLVLGGFVLWASQAELEEVTRGQGRIVPSSKEQVIQSLDPGILTEMLVREGEEVEKGQVLLRIDPTRAEALYRELDAKAVSLAASASRLRAEAYGGRLEFPDTVKAHPDVMRRETDVYKSRTRALDESLAGLTRGIELLDREIRITEPMVGRGLVSEVELL
ncbi:MAG: biotin/lipoyl-binding protein, partial [Gemmatimonadales bacterium]|nr:biotin/lipoyl-binding protein [Gemmatimonadales bacterium]